MRTGSLAEALCGSMVPPVNAAAVLRKSRRFKIDLSSMSYMGGIMGKIFLTNTDKTVFIFRQLYMFASLRTI
jgi:hypothetical protein